MVGHALALLMGTSLGLLGGGGSTLAVPILVYAFGLEPKQAIASGLAVVGATSLVGVVAKWRSGEVQIRSALLFAAVAMSGTLLGARLATHLPGAIQLLVLAGAMLASAGMMARSAWRRPGPTPPAPKVRASRAVLGLTAAVVGLLTGVAGIGGGFLIVPALVLFGGLPMKHAVGTSLFVIALNSLAGFGGYWGQVEIPWADLSVFGAIAGLGAVLGAQGAHRVSQLVLKRVFSVFLVAMSLFIFLEHQWS